MHIDSLKCVGSVSFKSAAKESEDDTKSQHLTVGLSFQEGTDFLDKYLDWNGAQPSSAFFRKFDGKEGAMSAGAYVRWLGIKALVLQVPEDPRYNVKITGSREADQILLYQCALKSLEVEFAANTTSVKAKVFCVVQDADVAANNAHCLAALELEESVLISLWSPQRDLVQQASDAPRAPSSSTPTAATDDPKEGSDDDTVPE